MSLEHFVRTTTFEKTYSVRYRHFWGNCDDNVYVVFHDPDFYYFNPVSFCNGTYRHLAIFPTLFFF